jgi:hypothetical protein
LLVARIFPRAISASLRHSHASQMLSDGAPITVVSERLGHASPNVTLAIYSHAAQRRRSRGPALWNKAMNEVLKASREKASAGGAYGWQMLARRAKKSV